MANWHKARHWEFLLPYFTRLEQRLTPYEDVQHVGSHPVRIGTEMKDWWITVDLGGGACHDVHELNGIREALLIVGGFGQLNHDCCMQYLQTASLFERGAHMVLDDPAFRPRFLFNLNEIFSSTEASRQQQLSQEIILDSLLSVTNFSDQFVQDWAKVLDMQDRVGRAPVDLKCVEIRLLVEPRDAPQPEVARHLELISHHVQVSQMAGATRASAPVAKRLSTAPIFSIHVLDLFMRGISFNEECLQALQGLVELGVPIDNIELPDPPKTETSLLGAATSISSSWWCAWRDLVCCLAGGQSATVRRLIVSEDQLQEPMLSSLLSALVYATNIEELEFIRGNRNVADANEAATITMTNPDELMLWKWLACLLFHEPNTPPNCLIQSLVFVNQQLDESKVEILSAAKMSQQTPLVVLAHAVISEIVMDAAQPQPSGDHTISIPAGTVVTIHGSDHDAAIQVQVTTAKDLTTGQVIFHNETTIVLLIPGFGICSVAIAVGSFSKPSPPPPPSAFVSHAASVRTSSLCNFGLITKTSAEEPPTLTSIALVEQLVGLLGGSLKGLYLHVDSISDNAVRAILASCPRLQNLSLGGAQLSSLDCILDGYDTGSAISSLELVSPDIDDVRVLPAMMDRLSSPSDVISTILRRLSIRHCVLYPDLCRSIEEMLAKNKLLTHFLYTPRHDDMPSPLWTVERHHGEFLSSAPLVLNSETRLAFLRVAYGNCDTILAGPLDGHVQEMILDYASTLQRRFVVRT